MEVGTVLSLPGAALAELAGGALDFAWIDLEHGAIGLGEVQAMAVGLAAAGCAAHVRLAGSGSERLSAILDTGVDGIVAPDVQDSAEAEQLTARLRYPPAGSRGYGPRRAGGYGRRPAFWSSDDNRVTCTAQIESTAGVAAAGQIARVDGVHALAVGCSDLSLDLGVPQQLGAASLRDAVTEVARAAGAAGVRFGLAASGRPAEIAALAGGRADFVVFSADTRLYSGAVDAAVRALAAP